MDRATLGGRRFHYGLVRVAQLPRNRRLREGDADPETSRTGADGGAVHDGRPGHVAVASSLGIVGWCHPGRYDGSCLERRALLGDPAAVTRRGTASRVDDGAGRPTRAGGGRPEQRHAWPGDEPDRRRLVDILVQRRVGDIRRRNALAFPFSAADGTPTQWRVVPRGGQLAATISGPNGTQEQLLERRTGWSESAPLAQQWRRSLEGRAITRTTRTNGGTSGGATTEFVASFCANSTLLTETRSVVSVNVPGAGGSQTSRQSGRGTWRTVSRGDVAAIVMTSDEGTMQLGVRRGDGDTMYVVQELVRLGAAQCQ
jgi:hypothetical protein